MIYTSEHPEGSNCIERLQQHMSGCQSVLELGCGFGDVMRAVRYPGRRLVGMDICAPIIEYARSRQPDMEFIVGDVKDALNFFPEKSFDAVILFDIVEHLEKEDGERLIDSAEKIAKKRVVAFLPSGVFPQATCTDKDWIARLPNDVNNAYIIHRATWYPEMMEGRGYTVWNWTQYHPPRPIEPEKKIGAMLCLKELGFSETNGASK